MDKIINLSHLMAGVLDKIKNAPEPIPLADFAESEVEAVRSLIALRQLGVTNDWKVWPVGKKLPGITARASLEWDIQATRQRLEEELKMLAHTIQREVVDAGVEIPMEAEILTLCKTVQRFFELKIQ